MKDFFNKLYSGYYRFQERVGNRDVAHITSGTLIAFILILYYFAFSTFVIYFLLPIMSIQIDMEVFKIVSYIISILMTGGVNFFYLYKKRYKIILSEYRNKKTKMITILFPAIAFILFNAIWIFKMLQNQGRF